MKHKTQNKYRRLKHRSKKDIKNKGLVPLDCNLDYASLQYYGIVRHYIQKRFDVKVRELELLLFLYPHNYFCKEDYLEFPHPFSTRTITAFLDKGWIEPMFEKYSDRSKHQVYRLSVSAKSIVRDTYDYLHGVKTLPESSVSNDLFKEQASGRDQMKAKAMAVLNMKIRGDNKMTPEHDRLNKRIVKRGRTNMKEKYDKYQDMIDNINYKRRLAEKKKELDKENGDNPD